MTTSPSGPSTVRHGPPPPGHGQLPVEITESKLYRPAIRPGVVPRPQLLGRLHAARDTPVVAVVAPAGYGKTTLLALWAAADDRPFAWLSLDRHDNDPIVLLSHLAVAVHRISPLPAGTFEALRTAGVSVPATVVPRLASALGSVPRPLVLVVDDVQLLEDGPSLDALVALVAHVGGTTQIALAGRGMPVPLARRRAEGSVVEVGTADLAFRGAGARSLLRAAGVELPDEEAAELTRRTEGWAAGLYLAALGRAEGRTTHRGAPPGGDDRLVTDYLHSELIAGLPPADLAFLTRTAVLDRLNGPLCDAVVGASDSAARLERLQAANLFLVPLDDGRREYRYHPLFRDLLRSSLHGDATRELLRRAAGWCEADGQLEVALHYAQEAGDVDRVARLAVGLAHGVYAAGRSTTLMAWLDWVDEQGAVERHPAVAALGAHVCALTGQPAAADRWAELAEHLTAAPSAPVDAVAAMWLATVRALMCRRGVEQMRLDAECSHIPGAGSAADLEYPKRVFLAGMAHLLVGDTDGAEALISDALELTDETRRPPFFAVMLAQQALLHLERGDWPAAEMAITQALATVRRSHGESHVTSAPVFAVAARVALHRRDLTTARGHLADAQRLRPLLSHAIPWLTVQVLLEMAEVAIGLADPSGARLFLRDAETVLRRRPDLGYLGKRTDELRERLGTVQAVGPDTSTLTSAELRLLPLLLTHLTVTGIAGRLSLSPHTVKSQMSSMYSKLDAHTRGEAVARAVELCLLGS